MPDPLRPAYTRTFLLIALLAAAPAPALLNIDGTRNQVFVFGGVTFAHSSNIFSQRDSASDYTVTAHAGAELKRRAGIIAVDSTARVDYVRYGEFTDENTLNPSFSLTLSKGSGRTTASLKLSAYRETRSDSAVNLRTSSWNLPVSLSIKYPINEKFYVTSDTGYLRRTYSDNQTLVDYTDFTEGVDLYYVYTSKLDLFAGYRLRAASTSIDGRSQDHWFSLGATGGLFSKMSGTMRFGYQIRDIQGGGQYGQVNATASLNWPVTRKLVFSLQAARDFNTIATGASVDSTSLALNASYAYNRKLDFNATLAAGRNDFLNETQADRRDTFFSWSAGARYRLNDHLQMGASYVYLKNWSSLSLADFENHGFSFDVSSRY